MITLEFRTDSIEVFNVVSLLLNKSASAEILDKSTSIVPQCCLGSLSIKRFAIFSDDEPGKGLPNTADNIFIIGVFQLLHSFYDKYRPILSSEELVPYPNKQRHYMRQTL